MGITAEGMMQVIIDDFCKREYGHEADFGNYSQIPIAKGERKGYEIEVFADIEHLRVQYFSNGYIYGEELFNYDVDMIDFLKEMTVDELLNY